ncbi:hypothetical protein [Bacillus smithii]|uniref:hypothetical protein n=1 Tax=Bacillus smithii TaxID=1479 RepID=UPI003D1E83AD
MAFLRLAYNDGQGQTYLRVVIDGLTYPATTYDMIQIYCYDTGIYYNVGGGGANSDGTYYGNPQTFSGLNSGTTYRFYALARKNAGGQTVRIPSSDYTIFFTAKNTSPPPTPSVSVYSISGRDTTIRINTGANTDSLAIDYNWTTQDPDTTISATSNSTINHSFTVPNFATNYTVWVQAKNAYGSSGWASVSFTSGSDTTPPSVSISFYSGQNAITVGWSASDNAGLRADNTYQVYISTANTSTLYSKGYTNNTSYTFQLDGQGNPFVVGASYLVRIAAYDIYGNVGYVDKYIAFSRTRPSNFSWSYSKTSGGQFILYATEWNGLQDRINEFREYKALVRRTFTRASSGMPVYAFMFNEVRNALTDLPYTITPPSTVSSGGNIYASDLNRLVSCLNSIS